MAQTTAVSTPQNSNQRAYIALIIGVTAVSLAAIFIRLAQGVDIPSIVIASGRLIVAAVILTPLVLRNSTYKQQIRQLESFELLIIGISGFFLAIHFWSWVTSLEHTSVLISVVLVTTTPIWVAILEIFFLKARLTQLIFLGLVVALMGSLVIGVGGEESANTSGNNILGAGLSAIGAMTVAVYLIIGRRLRPKLALIPYIWMVYGFAAIVLSIVLILSGTSITGYDTEGYIWILAMGLIPQLIGHSSLNYALAYLPATFISVASQVEPVGSAIIAAVVFSEIPGIAQLIGSAIILAGVTLASLGQAQLTNSKVKPETQSD